MSLAARGLAVERGGRSVVRGVDLDLRRGEVVALLGPNGAGKSTLLAALGGLLPPSAGTLAVDGRVAAALQTPALARRSVQANLESALGWWGVPREERGARASRALARIGVAHLSGRAAGSLSGGEARRVHLARVLALEPSVLLLDEPFAGLDPSARADLLYDAVPALRDPERAVLVIVHDRAEAWALADRIVVLLDGEVAAEGPPAEVLETPPSPAVASFLGFDGSLAEPDGSTRMLRTAHVSLDPGAGLRARVTRRVPAEDGVRLTLEVPGGTLVALVPLPGPGVGDDVGVRLTGGVRF